MPGHKVTAGWVQIAGTLQPLNYNSTTDPGEETPTEAPYDVIVGLIQSNMRGAATDYDVTADQYTGPVDMWRWSSNQIVSATEPLSTRDSATGMGAMNTFVKDYQSQVLANGRRILIINTARGGTGFTTPSTNPAGNAFTWNRLGAIDANNLALTTRDALVSILAELPAGSRIVAFLANHGSTDGTNNTSKDAFKSYLEDWIQWIRTETNTLTVPYIMMQMRPSLLIETRHLNIDTAQQEVAAAGAEAYIGFSLSPNGTQYNKADSVHFNAEGVREIGHRLFTTYQSLI